MEGYTDSSYGDAFADVYDEWYQGVSDVDATVTFLRALAGDGAGVLELAVGTGRLAIPLAASGVSVVGVDASEAMLDVLRAKDPRGTVTPVCGDMVDDLPDGQFALAFIAYNSFFGLLTEERQRACFAAVAARLGIGDAFVIEAFVPEPRPGSEVTVRSMSATSVVLSITSTDGEAQTAEGQYVELTEADGVRLRPWAIRYSTPEQLDAMAAAAGMRLDERLGSFEGEPFTTHSSRHVSVYRRLT